MRRGAAYHFCYNILLFHTSQWLLLQRALFTSEFSERLTISAGRTGTRCYAGRPQPRWEEGVELAKTVQETRNISLRRNNAISIGSVVRRSAIDVARNLRALLP